MWGSPPPLKRALELAARPPFQVRREGGLVLISYQEKGGFSEIPWDREARELRGIVYAEDTGEALSRPFHRFFNLGDPRCAFPPGRPLAAGDLLAPKVDGRLLQVFAYRGTPWFASRGSLRLSEVEEDSRRKAWTPDHDVLVQRAFAALGPVTLLFEVVDPERPVVERPREAAVVLLAVRHIPTGRYWFPGASPELEALLADLDLPRLSWRPAGEGTLGELHQRVRPEGEREGYVLWLAEGDFVKLKTDWALGFTRKRQSFRKRLQEFAQALLEDRLDDLLAGGADEPESQRIFLRLYRRLQGLVAQATALAGEARDLSRKEAYALFEERLGSSRFLLDLALRAHEGGEDRAWSRLKDVLRKKGPEFLEVLWEEA
ncbi:hypothetical protein CSW23_03580 [Thermus scotoductus]|uniref:RNA ligase n=1 Tax=Thermus scotoductus TaxID=37636 RepID=A0A430V5K3_THESC|nr:hypothetical protein [Thermus scotoductus]RTI01241.1 hypothetical protein CSW31_04020 [Thermus scotoductus]RTI19205.1 hypothetical protein CSW23_03580 [Thermus scotoductus]